MISNNKQNLTEATFVAYTEQDTADKLVLPYLSKLHGFPAPSSLDYQAQRFTPLQEGAKGRYDGLYLSGGFPYVILEAKRYAHELTEHDVSQARSYSTSGLFEKPVPFFLVSNGREHLFYKRSETLDPSDGLPQYKRIPATSWNAIKSENPGEIRQLLHEKDLLTSLLDFKELTFRDLSSLFRSPSDGKLDTHAHPLGKYLRRIIEERHLFTGDSTQTSQAAIRHSIEAISLHFTTKILFIKLIEDLSPGAETLRVVHDLFPRAEYDLIGGLFGFKVLNALSAEDENTALRIFGKSKRFYRSMAQDIATVSWQDIFRYGFRVHSGQYGKLFKSTNYDRFLPTEETLAAIHQRLITIDIRFAVLYGDPEQRSSVIGRIYEQLIDDELRNSIGAVYTPDQIIDFMIALGLGPGGCIRSKKVLEPSCGSGHFYRKLYRLYVNEVLENPSSSADHTAQEIAHKEALLHIFGRDIDPFAVQLTLLGTFLEQLKDNVMPAAVIRHQRARQWAANRSVDTQNSLDPITIDPAQYFDVKKTRDLANALSLVESCKRALNPDLIIGNPPYGVRVVKGDHYDDVYDLSSPDSYGYFIANALRRSVEGGKIVFIVSSSFLTIKTHLELRQMILDYAKIIRLVKLSRHTFPGIDIFPVIIELERCSIAEQRDENFYGFFDLWQLHPNEDVAELKLAFEEIRNPTPSTNWSPPRTRSANYLVRQQTIKTFSRLPMFEGRPSLYAFMQDVFPTVAPPELVYQGSDELQHTFRVLTMRGRSIVKLRQLAEVRVGLQCGDNREHFRAAAGVTGGAVRGGYYEVAARNIVSDSEQKNLTALEKLQGIEINDPYNDRYFVPLDKAAAVEIETGLLPQFYRPIEFYVDWSKRSVAAMRSNPSAVFRNSQFYFKEGISFSNTGIYSPTFRISHGGVFDQTGSCVFSDVIPVRALLGLLASTLTRYFAKAFINHGVHAQLDDLPIVLPTPDEVSRLGSKTSEIVDALRADPDFDYSGLMKELDDIVYAIYGLEADEREEVQTWFRRHYPKLKF